MPDTSLNDLWRDLQSAAETSPEPSRVQLPRQPVQRRLSLKEKLIAATLDGYVPALLALTAGAAAVTAQRVTIMADTELFGPGLFLTLLLLLLPLAALTRGLWAADRAGVFRYLCLTFLAVGLSYQSSALTLAGFSELYLNKMTLRSFATLLQNLYEALLTPGPMVFAAVVALMLYAGIRQVRRGAPWIEMRPAATAVQLLAILMLLTPWLLLAGCALSRGHLAPEGAYEEMNQAPTDNSSAAPWADLLKSLESQSKGGYISSEAIRGWSVKTVREAEAEALRLLPSCSNEQDRWHIHYRICSDLLRRSEVMQDPLELSWRLLERASFDKGDGIESSQLLSAFHRGLYPSLCAEPFTRPQLEHQLSRVSAIEGRLPEAREELDTTFRSLARGIIGSATRRPLRSTMKAFGWTLPFSPEEALAEYYTGLVTGPWPEILESADLTSYDSLQRSLNLALGGRTSFSIYGDDDALAEAVRLAGLRHSGLLLRTHLRAARLLISLRLYKLEHGAYPKSLDQLGLPEDELRDASYSSKGRVATVTFAACRNRAEGKGESWKLL